MKTRCRNYGTRRRMTAGGLLSSKQDSAAKDIENGGELTDEIAGKDPEVLHETRSQKQASKKRLHEDVHAETTKESSLAVAPDTANNSCGVATRSSTRPSKKIKLSNVPSNKVGNQENNAANEGVTPFSSPQTNRRKKPAKRPWESWGKTEKDTFFEALHEYGKDFDRICNFIAMKHKRRGDPPALIKNKDQVRHFYYRSLNKIAKYLPADQLSENDSQKKMMIELKGLICYGELRKRICGWNDKHGKKLEELLSHGTISIRNKGRNFKIKAPVCRALKRLASPGQGKEESESQSLAMPNKLTLELLPHNHAAWAAVQKLSKNPRLRTSVPPKKPLSLMLNFLMKKWHVVSRKTLEPLSMRIVIPPDFYINSDVEEQQVGSPSCKASSGDLCFVENTPTPDALEDVIKLNSPSSLVEEKCSGAGDSSLQGILQTAQEMTEVKSSKTFCEPTALHNGTAVDHCQSDKTEAVPITETCTDVTMEPCSVAQPANQDKIESCNEKSRPTFWTLETCANVTFGEIFCKLGRPPKLKLKYTWHDIEDNLAPSQTAVSLTKLMDVAAVEFTKGRESSRVSKTASKPANQLPAKNSSQSADKEKGTPKDKAGSKAKGLVAKTSHKLPFILPSVVTPATQISKNETSLSDLLHQTRPKGPRVQKRHQRPNVHRNILPRPVGSPSSVPPGAVAVSFIPQPGHTVGTILAAGVATSTVTVTTQSKATMSSKTVTGTASSSDVSVVSNLVGNPSPQAAAGASANNSFSNVNSTSLDLGMSGFADTDLLEVVDQLVSNTGSVATTSNSVDSIIGLALGTALDDNGTTTSGLSENSAYLGSLLGLKPSSLDLAAQSIEGIDSSAALSTSDVHIEELNSGVAGRSTLTSVASPTLENILNPVTVNGQSPVLNVQSPVSTASDVFFSITEPINSIVDSRSQQEAFVDKESLSVSSLLLSPTSDNGLPSSIPPQWLNGESSNLSIGSLLDKLTTSPKKDDKPVCLGESPGVSTFKEPSPDLLINTHHLLDAETALHAMMDENSVDFVRKFQDLAKEMAGENNSKTATSSSAELTFPSLTSPEVNNQSSDDSNSDSLNFRSLLRQTNMNGS